MAPGNLAMASTERLHRVKGVRRWLTVDLRDAD